MKPSLGRRQRLFFLLVVLAVVLKPSTAVPRGEEEEEEEEEGVADDVSAERTTITTTIITTTTTPSTTTTPADEEPPVQPLTTAIPESQKTPPTTEEITTSPPPPARNAPLYRLRDTKGETCILLEVDGLLTFKYKTTVNEEREADKFIPDEVNIGGTCDDDSATLVLEWSTYKLLWDFFKTPGGEKWYVDKIELNFNTSEKIFEHTKIPGRKLTLTTPRSHRVLLFPTPVGWSFTCKKETEVELRDHDDISATLLLREFHLQPFIFKGDDFGPEHECSARGVGTLADETAPIAVGSTLAIVVLLTVTGYGVYRYFKVKKVQYDTME